MKDTYKANTYWSPFGNNIVEFGQLITSTSNNENYGWVEGSGAYERGNSDFEGGLSGWKLGRLLLG
mgnify:CR=1 FL=1